LTPKYSGVKTVADMDFYNNSLDLLENKPNIVLQCTVPTFAGTELWIHLMSLLTVVKPSLLKPLQGPSKGLLEKDY
jgi:hypothetical protein